MIRGVEIFKYSNCHWTNKLQNLTCMFMLLGQFSLLFFFFQIKMYNAPRVFSFSINFGEYIIYANDFLLTCRHITWQEKLPCLAIKFHISEKTRIEFPPMMTVYLPIQTAYESGSFGGNSMALPVSISRAP